MLHNQNEVRGFWVCFLLAKFHGSSVMMEINEAGCVVVKRSPSCLFVVNRGNVSGRILVERNCNDGKEVFFFMTVLT